MDIAATGRHNEHDLPPPFNKPGTTPEDIIYRAEPSSPVMLAMEYLGTDWQEVTMHTNDSCATSSFKFQIAHTLSKA
jgi:hypothetical protein